MEKEDLTGYWQRKEDPTDYIHIKRVYRSGYMTGFQYYNRDGQETISNTPTRISRERLLEKYERRS